MPVPLEHTILIFACWQQIYKKTTFQKKHELGFIQQTKET